MADELQPIHEGGERRMRRSVLAVLSAAAVVLGMSACGSSSSSSGSGSGSSSSGPIKIGASIPLSGPLAGFGYFEKWGYQHAVNLVNQAGGIMVDGKRRMVQLTILDDNTDPNTTVNNVSQLITRDNVDALLGSCTDQLVEPGALVANRSGVPMVTPCAAVNTFKTITHWKWAWDLFFDSSNLTQAPFQTAATLGLEAKTDRKVAIIHSNGPNETVIGTKEWPAWAKQYGWSVVYNVGLPPSTAQFSSAIQGAKAGGADMLLVVLPPPAAIALRKQMAAAGYKPKIAVMEEGGEPLQFAQALGSLANGVMVGGYWDASFPYPGAKQLTQQFQSQTGQTYSQHIADTDAAAQVLLDAISRAGSTDKAKVNAAIAQTNTTYVVGPIKFGADHTSTLPMVETQWQNGKVVVIWPKDRATGKVVFPLP
jgi:branched-chain amino acid transport system substrate-binding protein